MKKTITGKDFKEYATPTTLRAGGTGPAEITTQGRQINIKTKRIPGVSFGTSLTVLTGPVFPDPVPENLTLFQHDTVPGWWINWEHGGGWTRIDHFTTNAGTPGT